MDFKAAKCPSCAGELQLPDNLDSAKCMYCGNTIVVREAIKLAAGSINLDNFLSLASAALESGNNAEAYAYYTKILEYDQENYIAWYGKGVSAAWQSTIAKLRIDEGISCIKTAFSKVPNDNKSDLRKRCATDLNSLAVALNSTFEKYFYDTRDVSYFDRKYQHKELYDIPIQLLSYAYNCDPSIEILKNILYIYVNEWIFYREDSIEKIKDYVKKTQALEPGFSFANYTKEIFSGTLYSHRLVDESFIAFVNCVDDKNKLSLPQPTPQTSSGGCFIATAAWGTPLADQVISLQLYRDTQLMKNEYGRRFVSLYYRVSPPIADMIRGNELLRAITRSLLKPVVVAVRYMSTQKG